MEAARGRGIATEALRALLAETDAAGVRVRAGVRPDNRASLKLLAGCGFTELRGSRRGGRAGARAPAARGAELTDVPRLVATDLDGTLVRTDGTVSAYAHDVIAALDERGVPVVFVTGRPLRWAEEVFEYVGAHGLAVVSNGALVWDVARDQVDLIRPIARCVGLEVCRLIRAAVPGTAFAVETVDGIALEPDFLERHPVPAGSRARPARRDLRPPALKVLGAARGARAAGVLGPGSRPRSGSSRSSPGPRRRALLEISAEGVTKASTLALLCDAHGCRRGRTSWPSATCPTTSRCWRGPARRTPWPTPTRRVIEAADHVAPANDDDGVATVLAGVFDL